METVQNTLVARESSGWRKSDTVWMLGLYGTAIGAGVLFLPINAGVGGSLFIRYCWFIALLLPTPSTALLLTSLVWCLRRALFCR